MNNKLVKVIAAVFLLALQSLHAGYRPTWDSVAQHDPAPEWFQDAKFGIYFHWGVFSVPAYGDEWYPRNMYNTGNGDYSHHLATFGNPFTNSSVQFFPYDYFITGHTNRAGVFCQFAPVLKTNGGNWDPDAWAQLFVNAGAKFAGPVAEHHDGYSMWNSATNEWNSVALGPHLDLAAIWSAAIRAQGLKFLMAIHTAYNFNGFYQYAPAQTNRSLQKLYGQLGTIPENQLWEAELKEVIDGYHPDILWQDFKLDRVLESNRLNFLSYYYNQALASNQPVVATFKDGFNLSSELYDFERGGSDTILYPFWLTDESISPTSWCYTSGMTYYATNTLLHELIDRVSKNGSLLLNIAPMADGTIPAAQQQILLGIGDWLSRFGEGIYSNRAWTVYGEGPTTMGGASFVAPVVGTSADIRFMRNKATNTLYAIVMGWPGSQLNITSLNSLSFNTNTLTGVQLLGANAGTYINLPWPSQDMTGLKITLPSQPYAAMAYVIKMTFSGQIPQLVPPIGYQWAAPVPVSTADATLNLPGNVVGAACFGATASSITVTLSNGTNIVFYGDGSVATCTGTGTTNGAFMADTGNANFNTVLNGFEYDGGSHTITLKKLVPGQIYSVQLFALDDRNMGKSENARLSNFQTPNNAANSSATIVMGSNAYVLGTFVAVGTNMVIQQNLLTTNKGNLNALVVRQLSGADILITSQPQSCRANPGGSVQLSASIVGGPPLTCQWQAGAAGSGIFTNFGPVAIFSSLAETINLNLTNLTAATDFRLVLGNSSGSITSSVAAVTIKAPLFAWQAPVIITTADAVLNLPGTIVGAACFGATSSSITVTLSNGTNIVFRGNNSVATCTGSGTSTGAFADFTTGNANFDSVLNGFEYDGGPHFITLKNLIPGKAYSVQFFGVDNRRSSGTEISRSFNFQDAQDPTDISQTAAMGANVYFLGTFVAPSNSVVIQQNLPTGNNGNLNALVVRQLSPAPVMSGVRVSDGNFIIAGTNGLNWGNFRLLESTNLALPLTNWNVLSTNQFLSNGSFALTNPLRVNCGFYRLSFDN